MKKSEIWLLIIIFTGCASLGQNSTNPPITPQKLWDEPIPTPTFLEGLEAITNETGTSLGTCIEFDGPAIEFTGDNGGEVSRILAQTLKIQVDGSEIREWVDASFSWFSKTICFTHSDVGYGLHVAAIEFETISGKNFSYMWAFRIVTDDGEKLKITYPDSLQS